MTQISVLMVAEKPSLADALSRLLAPGGHFKTRKGTTPVHEWEGVYESQPAKYKFTSVTGHVYNTDFTQEYNSWEIDPQKLFTAQIKKVEANPKMRITQHLRNEAKHIDYLILWLDCDSEGENICFEVIGNCLPSMKVSKMSHVLRARFSAITQQDVRRAMNHLVKPNENEAKAVDARQEFDLKVGVAFTRFQTRFFQGKYGDLDSTVISYGPCQSPTLAFCVERHDRIQSFQPEPFWTITPTIIQADLPVKLTWMRERLFDKQVTSVFMTNVEEAQKLGAKVLQVSVTKKSKARPHALNTVEMLKHGSSNLGIGPSECMSIAERLYMQGYISYPRTETSQYPPNFDLHEVLREQAKHPQWGDYCQDLLKNGFDRPSGGTDVGDHPPITPMRVADESELFGDTWRLYDFIARNFIGSISQNLKYTSTHVVLAIGEEKFECKGSQVTSPGFTSVMHWVNKTDEYIPEFKQGQVVTVKSVQMNEGKTSPPDYLTESELIGLMEQNGIGTDASISTHINNICQRNYVQVSGSGRKMIPTNLGIVLIHGYQKIDTDLSLPRMRSDMEQQLSLIASGKAGHKEVLDYFLRLFELKFAYFVKHISSMDELFEATFSPLAATGRPLSKCGKCKRYMKYISLKPNRLHCSTCDETYSLPLNGTIKLYRELTCPLDDFELVLYSTGSKGTGYPLCPYCYNHPPFENVKKHMACNHCPHPTCTHSMVKNAVCSCPESERPEDPCPGSLVLDATSAPRWKLSCNECNIVSSFVDTIKNVLLMNEMCECGTVILKAEFRENQNREPLTGCILCDDDIDALLTTRQKRWTKEKKMGRSKDQKVVCRYAIGG
ncbi:DNA topoisomerase [Halteromyces radiatus]|uniref:DNA topoisomerase n=1 Tax=Halteromyces radiatus TaxID=101107 RepID=UPI00222072DE|nr:DNA topoisomerase [Halteromyces radiatus]KAI8089922.1 DNA topoisomerase [Halteromyces radiatus]